MQVQTFRGRWIVASFANIKPTKSELRALAYRLLIALVRRTTMKDSTKDEVGGKIHEVKGKVKEQVGKLTNDPNLQDQGTDEKVAGKIQKKVGQIEKVFEQ
jgi:uncharacterized protein YjbJ (UPF0337 family)